MPQKMLQGGDVPEEDDFWAESSFMGTMGAADWKRKERTFHMKHDEEMNYNCKKCDCKISVHNRDWHDGLRDKCFDRMLSND